jgi:hypothetical protein
VAAVSAERHVIVIPERFCGPPRSANGGYTAGLLARVLGPSVRVTLRRPPPLGQELVVEHDGDVARLLAGDELIAEAEVAHLAVPAVAPVTPAEAAAASARSLVRDPELHPFPGCFVCGPRRDEPGLGLFAGPLGDGRFAAPWTPGPEVAGDDGAVAPEIVWAALDCPTAAPHLPAPPGAALVLGRITGRLVAPVAVGAQLVVISWPTGHDGRRHTSTAALVDDSGAVLAASDATWFEVPRH